MKKFVIGMVAALALGTAANAADLPARTYTKAPAPAPVWSWTGFYLGAGGGYGLFDGESRSTTGGFPIGGEVHSGGRGYFGTVSGGYDWQLNSRWVVGLFADAQFGDIKGTVTGAAIYSAETKNDLNYAAGVRAGYLVAPNVLSYVNGGYSHGQFKGSGAFITSAGVPVPPLATEKSQRDGWFVGGGFENNLDIFGIAAPGWFLKTEYRVAQYDRKDIQVLAGGIPIGVGISFNPYVQTISTQLVYRFNWGTPVVAKY
ncbi:MAG TPA: outer membrane beta-barrel protein [Afipia sp.]